MPISSSDAMASLNAPRGTFVDAGDQSLHYLSYGEGPAVVFLHGSGPGASGYSNFKHNYQAVVAAGCRAVIFDMAGFGQSTKPVGRDYTTEFFASTVKSALDAIGIERCVLVGNSLGGAVSIRLALDHPDLVAGLVLMAPGGIESDEVYYNMPGIKRMIAAFTSGALDFEGLRSLLGMLVKDTAQVDDALVAERFEILQLQPVDVLARLRVADMSGELGRLACPILGFWGVDDEFTPMSGHAKFLNTCPDCTFTLVSNCGHWVMTERPAMFNAQVATFLERLRPAFASASMAELTL
jgi:4,5:9,10-diseco-3-hydroxy-5,9,17-trioxoandrosta-1(10),2-diene-4-oate hydrolase